MSFTKLWSSIVYSTIWREELHTKVVWVTLMAMTDRKGQVTSSVPGLAHVAGVTLEQCQDALGILLAPDEHSRTSTHEGRRICEIEGGWLLLNYEKHRDAQDSDKRRRQTREAVRRHRAKVKAEAVEAGKDGKPKRKRVSKSKPRKAQAEAEAEAEADPDLPSEDPVAPAKPKRRRWVAPLTEREGLLGNLARAWSKQHGGGEPEWALGECIQLSKLSQRHGDDDVEGRWGKYLADEGDFYKGHPLVKFVTSMHFDRYQRSGREVAAQQQASIYACGRCGCEGSSHDAGGGPCLRCGQCNAFVPGPNYPWKSEA